MTIILRELWLSSTLFALITGPATAGPCSNAIAQAQAELKSRVDVDGGCATMRPESIATRLHHQPTHESVTRAARELRDKSTTAASLLRAIARAQEADTRGDRAKCLNALQDFHGLMK
jgi:hypothetical protein